MAKEKRMPLSVSKDVVILRAALVAARSAATSAARNVARWQRRDLPGEVQPEYWRLSAEEDLRDLLNFTVLNTGGKDAVVAYVVEEAERLLAEETAAEAGNDPHRVDYGAAAIELLRAMVAERTARKHQ